MRIVPGNVLEQCQRAVNRVIGMDPRRLCFLLLAALLLLLGLGLTVWQGSIAPAHLEHGDVQRTNTVPLNGDEALGIHQLGEGHTKLHLGTITPAHLCQTKTVVIIMIQFILLCSQLLQITNYIRLTNIRLTHLVQEREELPSSIGINPHVVNLHPGDALIILSV